MANRFILGGMPVDLGELYQMDYSHHKIHEGEIFKAGVFLGTLGAGGTLLITIFAGTIAPHLITEIHAGGDARICLKEGAALTGGTAVTVFNMNRSNTGTCLSTVRHGGTVTGGTIINDVYLPGGSGPQSAGGGARANNEFMLRLGTTTTIELINLTTAGPASIAAIWYEENED